MNRIILLSLCLSLLSCAKEEDIGSKPFEARPHAIHRVEPVYPREMAMDGVEGEVTLTFDLTKEGFVTGIQVIESSHPVFVESARHAVSQWIYDVTNVRDKSLLEGIRVRLEYTIEE